jgi:hypothetical protein
MQTIEEAVDSFLNTFTIALEALLTALLSIVGDPLIATIIGLFGGGES